MLAGGSGAAGAVAGAGAGAGSGGFSSNSGRIAFRHGRRMAFRQREMDYVMQFIKSVNGIRPRAADMVACGLKGIREGHLLPRRTEQDLADRVKYCLRAVREEMQEEARRNRQAPPTEAQAWQVLLEGHPVWMRDVEVDDDDASFAQLGQEERQLIGDLAEA